MSPERRIQFRGKETGRVIVDANMFEHIGDDVALSEIPEKVERDLRLAQAILANSGGQYEPLEIVIDEPVTVDPTL